jgi:hypothetical protein
MESFVEEFFEEWMDSIINDTPFFETNNFENGFDNQHFSENYQSNSNYESNSIESNVHQNIASNIYRVRRTLEVENQVSQLQNNMIQNLYEILTEHILPSEISETSQISDFEDVKVVLTSEQFDKLKHSTLDNENDILITEEQQCNICMEQYSLNDKITQLGCTHFFHYNCIEYWLCNEHVTCPICRKDTRETINKYTV